MRGDDRQVKSILELKISSNGSRDSTTVSNESEKRLEQIRSAAISALKIITIASIADDESSINFLADYVCYKRICEGLVDVGLMDDGGYKPKEKFDDNPTNMWIELLVVIFISLYSFKDHNGILCDIITSSTVDNPSEPQMVGRYFSKILRLESYDWSEHKVDLFIPFSDGEKILFIVDDEPVFYSIN